MPADPVCIIWPLRPALPIPTKDAFRNFDMSAACEQEHKTK